MRLLLATALLCGAQAPLSDVRPGGTVSPLPAIANVPRIGLNLGLWTSWGAEQLAANVLKNPGFEGVVDRAIVVVRDQQPFSFADDTDWLARPDGFWDGGTYSILTGSLAGHGGRIGHSGVAGGRGWFQSVEPVAGLAVGDIVAVTRTEDGQLPAQWWLEGDASAAGPAAPRPGSAGVRSLRLPGEPEAVSYLDAIGERAGKLLPLNGEWTLSVWARAENGPAALRVRVARTGTPAFLDVVVPLEPVWREYHWTLRPADTGPAGTLAVRFAPAGDGEPVYLDDASFSPRAPSSTGFRSEVVETIRTLRPGYLRDWQGQLGDTLANRLAPAQARRSSRYRPGGAEATDFAYSLPDFLRLARETGAQPWVVLPATLSPGEWRQAGAYLRAQADALGFQEIVVEFGNENWNELFRPAGILSARALTDAANRAFALLAEGSGNDPRIRPVLSGSFHDPSQHGTLQEHTPPSTLLAFAPYWAYDPTAPNAFFPDGYTERLRDQAGRHATAIYEMNAHSLNGTAPAAEVNRILSGPEAGAAVAWHSIGALEAGVGRICLYTLAGFDTPGEGKGRLINLFGITRDLAAANRFRPEGDALALLNGAIAGDYHAVDTGNPELRAAAFRAPDGWRVVVVSRSPEPQQLRLSFPGASRLPAAVAGRGGAVRQRGAAVEIDVPPFGILLASPEGNRNDR